MKRKRESEGVRVRMGALCGNEEKSRFPVATVMGIVCQRSQCEHGEHALRIFKWKCVLQPNGFGDGDGSFYRKITAFAGGFNRVNGVDVQNRKRKKFTRQIMTR